MIVVVHIFSGSFFSSASFSALAKASSNFFFSSFSLSCAAWLSLDSSSNAAFIFAASSAFGSPSIIALFFSLKSFACSSALCCFRFSSASFSAFASASSSFFFSVFNLSCAAWLSLDSSSNAASVSYTHLTLPTTPYV